MIRNGGELLVESLVALGARKSFGVPGESYLAVLDALFDTPGQLDYVLCRNEGGAAFMAAAYGKLMGTPGICFVTRGPGVTNASIGVHTAMQDSSPMILFVGQVGTDMKGREAFQEIDYRAVFGTVAKWVTEIDDVSRLTEIVARAWTTAITGRPGPVVVALPEDMLSATTDIPPLDPIAPVFEPAPSAAALAAVHELLASATRPLILIGGINWNPEGRAALQSFAESANIPVLSAFRYQDQYSNHSPVFAGEAGVGMPAHIKALVRDADVMLAINVRFGEISTDGYTLLSVPQPIQKVIHVHGSDREIGKIYVPALGIHAGPNAFARALVPVKGEWDGWTKQARQNYESSFDAPKQPGPVDMVEVSAWLRTHLPEDVILTNGAGNFTVWPNKFFKFGPHARLLAPQSGAMGYGLPAAIAAKVAFPNRTVVCFAGDGDFQMTCSELGSAMQANARPIVLLLNNGIYGTIRAHQERTFPARVSGTNLENPDFVALGRSYGFHTERVEQTDAFPAAFGRAMGSSTGAILEIVISPEALTPRQTLSQMRDIALASRKGNS